VGCHNDRRGVRHVLSGVTAWRNDPHHAGEGEGDMYPQRCSVWCPQEGEGVPKVAAPKQPPLARRA